MVNIQFPDDLISLSLFNIFNYRRNERKFLKAVKNWNKKIVLHIIPFYPVTVVFEGEEIKFSREDPNDPDLRVKIHINDMLDIAYGRMAPTTAIDEKRMEMEGLEKDAKIMPKFFNIFVTSMSMVAAEPNLNYFEINKDTR